METKANIDKVTVYRILSLFKQHRIIRELASAGGANYFEMATLENPVHPHFQLPKLWSIYLPGANAFYKGAGINFIQR
ncbi:MAG: transcriptional repressor [Desulfosudis oleivorans]|nr:transcriptional repressor [Desulfosudis oleivorans]